MQGVHRHPLARSTPHRATPSRNRSYPGYCQYPELPCFVPSPLRPADTAPPLTRRSPKADQALPATQCFLQRRAGATSANADALLLFRRRTIPQHPVVHVYRPRLLPLQLQRITPGTCRSVSASLSRTVSGNTDLRAIPTSTAHPLARARRGAGDRFGPESVRPGVTRWGVLGMLEMRRAR